MLVEFSDVTLLRGEREVVRDLSFQIPRGAPFAITGPSGSGKTSLLLAACGLLHPLKGRVCVAGREVHSLSSRERAKHFGLVFQDYQLFPHLNVLENIRLAPEMLGSTERLDERIRELLALLGMESTLKRAPHELSGGQKQRVAIARSLILEPQVLFLDEPSAALDEKTTLDLVRLLQELNSRSQIVVVSHDRTLVRELCPIGVSLMNGQLSSLE